MSAPSSNIFDIFNVLVKLFGCLILGTAISCDTVPYLLLATKLSINEQVKGEAHSAPRVSYQSLTWPEHARRFYQFPHGINKLIK